MSKLSFSRNFLKCLYNEKLKLEVNTSDRMTLSEFMEESLMSYLNINLVDIDLENIDINVDILSNGVKVENNRITDKIEDIEFNSYVYVYMDPRKSLEEPIIISISDDIFEFEFLPFYIGKGRGDRMFSHLKPSGKNVEKDFIIKDILLSGHDPVIRIIKGQLMNSEAYNLENMIISRLDNLTNISGGKSTISKYGISDRENTIEYDKVNSLINTLNSTNNNGHAASLLGISTRTLYRMKSSLNIKRVNNKWIQIRA